MSYRGASIEVPEKRVRRHPLGTGESVHVGTASSSSTVVVHGNVPLPLLPRDASMLAFAFLAEDGLEVLGAADGVFGVDGGFEGAREVEEGELFGESLLGCQRCK